MPPHRAQLWAWGIAAALAGCTGGSDSAPPPPAGPAPGALISGFGTGGVATSNPSTRDDIARAVAQIGTKLYIAGADQVPGAGDGRWRIEKWCA